MKLNYIFFGFSSFLVSLILGVILGSFLNFLNFDYALDFSIFFVYLLLVLCGYFFAKNAKVNKYKNSFLLSVVISFSFAFICYTFKSFDISFVIKSLLGMVFFMGVGIFFYYLRFDLKK